MISRRTVRFHTAMLVKIGIVVATQGPVALLGRSFLKAVELAREEVTGTRNRYELAVEEIAAPDRAVPAIQKLIGTDNVKALIVGLSISGQAVKPYATAARIPLFCICSVAGVGDDVYTFTIMPLAEDEAARWVGEAGRRGIRRIAALTQDYPSINNHVQMLKEEAAKAGIAFVREEKFEASATDFRDRIASLRREDPDVFFVEAFNPALDLAGAQLKDAGVRNLASVVAFSVSDRPELFEGGWYTDSYVSPDFRARLETRFPGERLATHMMPYAYDSLKILVRAFESGRDVLGFIRGMTEYSGTAGGITKEQGSGNFRSSPAVWVIRGGRPALLP